MTRFTYFAFCKKSNTMKIGSSESPRDRVKELVERPRLILVVEDSALPEKAAHELFGKYRVIGEWFAVSPESVVQTLKLMGVPFVSGNKIPGTRAERFKGQARNGKRTIQVILDEEVYQLLAQRAEHERRSLSNMSRRIISLALKQSTQTQPAKTA